MLKQKFCLWWIWYLLFDNAHFQRWLAWHRRRGWELAHVGGLFFHFTRGDGTDYRYYVQVMKDFPWTEQDRAYIAGVEELGVTYLGCFLHRAYFRWVDDGRPEEMFSDLASQAQEARCVRSVARQFFCETRTEFLRKNSPVLRSKSETRSLASTAPKMEGAVHVKGRVLAWGGAAFAAPPLAFCPWGSSYPSVASPASSAASWAATGSVYSDQP